ncbi:MAG: acyl-CoA dehydrogenase family protein [Mycobacterium sp.]|nr:acyl-CoA dehydrogenase family protein [Mycobacterium sp.]
MTHTLVSQSTGAADAHQKLLAAAKEMKPRLMERAQRADAERRVPDETINEMVESGFFKFLIPKRFGGDGGGVIGQIEIAAELARGCPSTAWVYTLVGDVTGFAGAFLPREGADTVYASHPNTLVCGVAAFNGTAKKSPGGYRVTGSWGFASGCLYSHWFMGGTVVLDDTGQVTDQIMAFMPMEQLKIKDTWHVMGMCGTGSNTIVADDLFVPEAQVFSLPERLAREQEFDADADPADRMPIAPLFSIGLMGPTLGAAQELHAMVSEKAHTRNISYFDFPTQADSAVAVATLGETGMMIDTAKLHVARGAADLEMTTAHHVLDRVTRARCRADAGHASENLRRAADMLMSIGGAGGFATASRNQQFYRDIQVGSRHAFVNSRPLYEAYGREAMGLSPNITSYI